MIRFIKWALIILVIADLNVTVQKHERILKEQDSLFKDMYYAVIDTFERTAFIVTVTTWNPTRKQCDNTPHITACNFLIDTINPSKHRIIALSNDLLEHFYYGEKVKLENCGKFSGYYTVADCSSKRLIRTVDICIGKNEFGGKFNNAILRHLKQNNDR